MTDEYEYRIGFQWTNKNGQRVIKHTAPLPREQFDVAFSEYVGKPIWDRVWGERRPLAWETFEDGTGVVPVEGEAHG
jgi:hypothetical protein